MKSDHLFSRLMRGTPEVYFELAGLPPSQARRCDFKSEEIKESALRIDGLFIPPTPRETLLFVETQLYKKPDFYPTSLAKKYLYLARNSPEQPHHQLLIFGSRSHEPDSEGNYRHEPRLTRVYLDELPEVSECPLGQALLKLLVTKEKEVADKARYLVDRTRTEAAAGEDREKFFDLIVLVLSTKLPNISQKEILVMVKLFELHETRLYREIMAEGEAKGEARGEARGAAKGEAKGKAARDAELIPRLAAKMPVKEIAELLGVSESVVKETISASKKKPRKR